MHLGVEDCVNVGLVESVFLHALEEEADGCGVGDVRGRCHASTAGEEADDASSAVHDDRTRVNLVREGARLGVERKDGPFFGGLSIVIVELVTGIGENIVGTAGGQVNRLVVLPRLITIRHCSLTLSNAAG
jgi:hypothetical protein